MERYNRDFNNLFDSPNPGLFLFCERVRREAVQWENDMRMLSGAILVIDRGGKMCIGQKFQQILKTGSQRKRGRKWDEQD